MAKVKIGIRKDGAVDAKKNLLGSLVANLTDNTPYANINPSVTILLSLLNAISAKQSEIAAAKANLGQLLEQLNTLDAQAWERIVAAAADVQNISNGDTASILSTGFTVASSPTPASPPVTPQNLRSRQTDAEGVALLDWDSVKGSVPNFYKFFA